MAQAVSAISVENLTVRYEGGPTLLTEFSLEVQPGECIAIQGESGCGKSTLLHCVCGLIPRSIQAELTGSIRLFGKLVAKVARHEMAQSVGIVFQNPDTQLFCDTVEDELAFGMENICLPKAEMAWRIQESLAMTGLEKYRLASPKQLSGGQKQLVVLAAVLALCPKILMLDEAFSQLDEEAKARFFMHISALRDDGKTIVMVDHDPRNLSLAHRILRLGGGHADGG